MEFLQEIFLRVQQNFINTNDLYYFVTLEKKDDPSVFAQITINSLNLYYPFSMGMPHQNLIEAGVNSIADFKIADYSPGVFLTLLSENKSDQEIIYFLNEYFDKVLNCSPIAEKWILSY